MGGAFKIGRFSGIDVRVHWTFFLLLVFFAFIGYQASGGPVGVLTATVTIVALFFCVLLHEFGHSLVAQRLAIEIHGITLLPLGGVSNLESLPEKPADEVKITLAGPLVNVALAPIFFGVGLLLGAVPRVPADLFTGIGSVGQFFFYLGYLNVVLAVFNLIPAFPMDGGRILRALLATRLGAVRATDISSAVGQLFAVAFFLVGLISGNLLLALVAVFIFFGASGESQMVRQRELTRGLTVSDVMWHLLAPRLAEDFTVIATDLRGYGDSSKPETGPDHEPYSKRTMALDQVELMRYFGFERFALCGHDRGGRVGYHMALDHPGVVTTLAVLDDVLDVWRGWAEEVRARVLDCGHYLPEEAPEETYAELRAFFSS
jgi:Zn-dependent protease